ncbi:MAG: glycosyltransferase [Deltaproteobacteria bacterium]|nr:glycosyltransferase [Deltaproteobacteria bacterium]
MPQVSVIIPTYNRASCVTEAIDSVLAQTFTDYEIIVVDDGSTDNTREILEPYEDRIRYIYQQNSGVSGARNAGILAANGDWVAFLDSDDEYYPDGLRLLFEPFHENPAIVARLGNVSLTGIQDERELFGLRGIKLKGPAILERPLLTALKWFSPQAFAVRRNTLLRCGLFDTRLNLYEDSDLMCRVALQGPWMMTPDLVAKAIRKGSDRNDLSSAHALDPEATPRNLIYIYRRLLLSDGLTSKERRYIRRQLGGAWHDWAEACWSKGKKLQRRLLLKAIIADGTPWGVIRSGPALLFGPLGFKLAQGFRNLKRKGQVSYRRSEADQERNRS